MRSDTPRLRIAIIGIVAVSLFAALFTRLWYLQVLASDEFQLRATANQRREVIEPAPRGRILDRNGVVLVDNRLSFVASLDRAVLRTLDDEEEEALLQRIARELRSFDPTVTVDVIRGRIDSERYSPYMPVPVAEDIPEDLAVYFRERADEFLGALKVESRAIRTYPYGQLAAHVLGYVGPINDTEYEARRGSPLRYQLSDEIGKSGVEQSMESMLRGQPGRRVLEVDAKGRTVRELEGTAPVPGHDVYLSIDIRVQAVAEEALEEELVRASRRRMNNGYYQKAPAGSVVVLDPNDDSVLAMASYPTFRPADLTDGIDNDEWAALNDPEQHVPLINRAIQGEYAPGSTFKLITAYAALETGLVTPETVIPDGGVFRVPNCTGGKCTFNNAGSVAHGNVDLRRALTVSSDVYFYKIGSDFWNNRSVYGETPIQDAARRFGFAQDTGIPLPSEHDGWIPTPENRRRQVEQHPNLFSEPNWYTGDNVNISVGQGDVIVTPLQLANAYAALANGGTLMAPNIVREVRVAHSEEVVRTVEPRPMSTIPFAPGWREAMMDGFVGVTQHGEGTAVGTFRGFPNWVVAGKTGTAEVRGKADTSLFVGMAPAERPQYVAAAILEESGFGGAAAAPLVRRIFESIADPALTPTVVAAADDPESPRGFTLSIPLPEQVDALGSGDRGD